ncbi:hypothetical protein PI124_g15122 [Phytophthora idaei]|nr:hypothetical protein PI125_g14990 [Phytophthora idaei]KAG3144682.1 hypothetical protein PI126_g14058 [Phytophthora idaei]KAG3239954.1 hypothetical protein PI124_g15122 [Phytophthora idaei]
MYSPLLSVELVLNHQEDAAALQDLGPVIADFLGPVRNLSLHDACHIGSFKLLDALAATAAAPEHPVGLSPAICSPIATTTNGNSLSRWRSLQIEEI